MNSVYTHHQAAHCESGVTSNLLRGAGLPVSEAMAFGIGSGLFFTHIPFVKVMGLPLTSYRSMPGGIFKKTCKRLGVPFAYHKFRDPLHGRRALDEFAAAGRAVGVRSNIFWLPYIPEQFRFQFNAHNLVVYGQEGADYQVSDPVMENVTLCPPHAMSKARFSKGVLAPKGLLFFPLVEANAVIGDERLLLAVRQGVRETANRMSSPVFFAGVSGIRYLSRKMRRWPSQLDAETVKLYLANVVRMQEEIGTGGAGFRFLYAAFLQEAGEKLHQPALLTAARDLTDAGNVWREFATLAAKFCKDRLQEPYGRIPDLLLDISAREAAVFKNLRRQYH